MKPPWNQWNLHFYEIRCGHYGALWGTMKHYQKPWILQKWCWTLWSTMIHYQKHWKSMNFAFSWNQVWALWGTMGHYETLSKTLDFVKMVLGTMGHYETLSKTLKINEFCTFMKSGVGTMGHYGALWNTIKNLGFYKNGAGHYGAGHYETLSKTLDFVKMVALWDTIKNIENQWILHFMKSGVGTMGTMGLGTMGHYETLGIFMKSGVWNTIKNLGFCKNGAGHYGALWDTIKNIENQWILHFHEIRCGHYGTLWGTMKHYQKPWIL